MATGGGSTDNQVCPLCTATVGSGSENELQLHYLTNCSGYDKSDERGVATDEATPTGVSAPVVGGECRIQFMWQPLSQITYAKVVLLASFEPGSVELSLDTSGGFYSSSFTSITRGTYEGQLVLGDSYMHQVKQFTVQEDEGIVVLEFDVSDTTMDTGMDGGTINTGLHGTGFMQQNPSYNNHQDRGEGRFYSNELGGGGAVDAYQGHYGDDSYGDGSYGDRRRRKTGTASEGTGLQSTNDFEFHKQYPIGYLMTSQPSSSHSHPPTSHTLTSSPPHPHTHTSPPTSPHTDQFSDHLNTEGFEPVVVRQKDNAVAAYPSNEPHPTKTSHTPFSSRGSGVGGSQLSAQSNSTLAQTINISSASPGVIGSANASSTIVSSNKYSLNRLDEDGGGGEGGGGGGRAVGGGAAGGGRAVGGGGGGGRAAGGAATGGGGRETGKRELKSGVGTRKAFSLDVPSDRSLGTKDGELGTHRDQLSSPPTQEKQGFTVTSIHRRRGMEDLEREYEEKLAELREELVAVSEERDSILDNRERVRAQWEGRIRRLKRQLQQYTGEEVEEEEVPEDLDGGVDESIRARVAALTNQIAALSSQLESRERELSESSQELSEMRDRNTALENQLTEYMEAMQEQTKTYQRSMANRGNSDGSLIKAHQEAMLLEEFAKKQQLEYKEALQSLQKKAVLAEETQTDNLKLHQLNVTLTAELEDYRHQTKALLKDLSQREEEVAVLQETRSRSMGENKAQLELETMRQKCDAYRDEVEKLSQLREEVVQLQEANTMLYSELENAKEDSAGLGKHLQELSKSRGKEGDLMRQVAEYDQLMERFTELQTIRAQLESELAPLRGERAAMLTENAQLREGSQLEKYVELKKNFNSLTSQCVQLQENLAKESDISKKLESTNHELQKQLLEATDEKHLQSIRERMERYRQERDQMKTQVVELQLQVGTLHEDMAEREETIVDLQKSQEEAVGWQEVQTLSHKLEEYEKRMKRYREERNESVIVNKTLHEQVRSLETAMSELQLNRETGSYDSEIYDSVMSESSSLAGFPGDGYSSPSAEAREAYSPDKYSDSPSALSEVKGSEPRKRPLRTQAAGTPTGAGKLRSSRGGGGVVGGPGGGGVGGGGATEGSPSVSAVLVRMKDGTNTNMVISKPKKKLNAKLRPTVIVKRSAGKYETATLVYVGVLDGKEMAGVVLDQPRGGGDGSSNDGKFKDGRHHFKCTPGHGLYCPVSNIYVEADSTSV